jgi:hypothetical protein
MEIIGLRCQWTITFWMLGAGARAEITALAETHLDATARKRMSAPSAVRHQRAQLSVLDAPVFKTKAD